MSIKHLGGCPRILCFLRLPRQTGHRVFPGTAFRRPSPFVYQQPLSLIHSFEPRTRFIAPTRHHFSASSLTSCQRLFLFTGQCRSRAWTFTHGFSIADKVGAFMHPSLCAAHGRSMASRSGQVVLSSPSSLQGHSDFPCARNAPLAGFTQLETRLPPLKFGGNAGISGPISHPLSLHAADLTPGPRLVLLPSASQPAMAFPYNVEGRRVAPIARGSSLPQALPAITACAHFTRLHHSSSYYGLQVWPAPRTGSDHPVWPGSPSRCRVGASSAQVLPLKRALCLHTQKGNWRDELLSVH